MGAIQQLLATQNVRVVTWNPSDKSSRVVLSSGNLAFNKNSGTTGTWDGARATFGRFIGKYYFEVLAERTSGTDSNVFVGIAKSTSPIDTASGFPGGDVNGYGIYTLNGNKYNNATPTAYSSAWDGSTTYGVAVDFDALKVWFANENTYGSGGDPAAGTGEAFSISSGTYFPMSSQLNINVFRSTLRTTAAAFLYAPPTGFAPWQS